MNKIELTDKERQIAASFIKAIENAELAKVQLKTVCTVIIDRCGYDSTKEWVLDAAGKHLEELSDGVASE